MIEKTPWFDKDVWHEHIVFSSHSGLQEFVCLWCHYHYICFHNSSSFTSKKTKNKRYTEMFCAPEIEDCGGWGGGGWLSILFYTVFLVKMPFYRHQHFDYVTLTSEIDLFLMKTFTVTLWNLTFEIWVLVLWYFIWMFLVTCSSGGTNISLPVTLESVIYFQNCHHGSGGPLLMRTMSPKQKTMSPNFISRRILNKQVNV